MRPQLEMACCLLGMMEFVKNTYGNSLGLERTEEVGFVWGFLEVGCCWRFEFGLVVMRLPTTGDG